MRCKNHQKLIVKKKNFNKTKLEINEILQGSSLPSGAMAVTNTDTTKQR